MLHQPFYDPTKSYNENYESGPFGAFADGNIVQNNGEPTYDFHDQKVYLPFGIPPGPLINSNFVKGAFEKGFDIAVYKTVRSASFPCHPHPNVLSVRIDGDLTIEKTQGQLVATATYTEPLSITNSFGVPSKDPDVWQEDVQKAMSYAGKGQVLVLSFMGTVRENQSQEAFIKDYALAGKLADETGTKILEVNLSCPNIGNEGLVCYNLDVTRQVCDAIRNEIGDTPLILKVGYYKNDTDIETLAAIANEYANDVTAINTLQATVVDEHGNQALPGKNRLKSGVCGTAIKWAGLDMVRRLKKIKDTHGYTFTITGVGGVTQPIDYTEYRNAGADAVMSATGAMWNPYLAKEIKQSL